MNLDKLRRFPNQNAELRFNECVGETIADILGNVNEMPMDSDFSYAAGLAVQSKAPTDAGEDAYAGFLGACAYGALPDKDDLHDPRDTSALMEADFRNYTTTQKQLAAYFAQNGVKTLYGFDAVTEYLLTHRMGAGLTMRWYSSFNDHYSDGTLRTPPKDDTFSYHCVAVYENTEKGLRVKSWLGPEYGRGGYAFLPKSLYYQCFPTGYGFDNDAWRWLTIVKIALMYPKTINQLLPILVKTAKSGRSL